MTFHDALAAFDADDPSSQALEQDIRDELLAHLAMSTEQGIAQGLSPEQAKRQAIEQFGNFEQTISACKRQKLGAFTMKKRTHQILTASLLLLCVAMTGYGFAARARVAERESALHLLNAKLMNQQSEMQSMKVGSEPQLITVRIGDQLEVVETYQPGEWTGKYEVERDGSVLLPALGHVQVFGLTRSELESRLTELYAPYYALLDLYVRVHRGPVPPLEPSPEETGR